MLSDNTRMPFIRKVYSILCTQIFIAFCMVCVSAANESYRNWQRDKIGFMIIVEVLWIVLMYTLVYVKKANRLVPFNYICLFAFTICHGYIISHTCAYYDWQTLVIAASITLAMFFGLTAYAFWTKTDFTIKGGLIFTLSLSFLGAIIIGSIIRDYWAA